MTVISNAVSLWVKRNYAKCHYKEILQENHPVDSGNTSQGYSHAIRGWVVAVAMIVVVVGLMPMGG